MGEVQQDCGFSVAVRAIGGKWKIDILCELGTAARRFGRLRRAIPAISEKMLAQQLKELEADGLVERRVYDQVPAKVVYSLTAKGTALNDAAAGLCRWGMEFGDAAEAGAAAVGDEARACA